MHVVLKEAKIYFPRLNHRAVRLLDINRSNMFLAKQAFRGYREISRSIPLDLVANGASG
jgi:hypothetical protein